MDKQTKYLPADERRQVIVETVVELAAERNPNDITTASIAQRMGLTQGALFRHFPNKSAIIQAVMEWVAERLLSRVDEAAKESLSPLAALEAIFMAHVEFVAEHPGVPRMLFGELQRSEETAPKHAVRTLMQHYSERLQHQFEEGKRLGEIDMHLDTGATINLFIGSIQGLVMQSLLAGNVGQIRENAVQVFAIYRRGIRSTL